ncbi:MAG TPA: phenylalanine--tRNA ligase subunit beta [Spirochaetota bacterium]|jgi:phenylalanyl-tRNA synthetase beta chain|nr:MAG: Phenylalanine--tRNA ligase beta subunit [Spirochaetes bacterium ADurb.Bin133]HNZ26962.1 phenylalanine--tRNA ligase subunit beta [Spirochaetota bacterium]HPY87514.1 phenylalanine--tRNA ligase subunit beta [Spirochaetota bacterium]
MKISYEWLMELIEIDKTPEVIAEKFYMSGLEVETMIKTGIGKQNIVCGEIKKIEKHPKADLLSVLTVDCGDIGEKTIITNMTGMKTNDKLLVGLEGAEFKSGVVIKPAKIKEVQSDGMIVRYEDLGLPYKGDFAVYPDKNVKNGTMYADIDKFEDTIIEVDLTANRGDCLGLNGIAREVYAQFGGTKRDQEISYKKTSNHIDNEMRVEIRTKNCLRYCGAVVKNVKIAPSPLWMQLRLIKSGIRPINNIVDITNYIMMECNQPLHAFDMDKIAERKIIVRDGGENEILTTLDEIDRKLTSDDIIISDPKAGLCIGGVMGGQISEVGDKTVNIFLESAFFRPQNIRRTSKRLGLKSESSYRFERTIDIENCDRSLKRALYFFDKLGVGEICDGIIDVYPGKYEERKVVVSSDWINNKLGTDIPVRTMSDILESLDFEVSTVNNELCIVIPSWRGDVSIKEDISEEIARIYGLNNIKPTYKPSENAAHYTPFQKMERDIRDLCYGFGLDEALNLSFVGSSIFDKMRLPTDHDFRNIVKLEDPLSDEAQGMRSSLIPGMIRTLSLNITRKNKSVSIFEVGNISIPTQNELPDEYTHCSVALAGIKYEKDHTNEETLFDYYDIKGIADSIFRYFGEVPAYRQSEEVYLHPYQQSKIFISGEEVGLLGKINPIIADSFDIDTDCFVMEFSIHKLCKFVNPKIFYKEIPRYPSVERDLSVIIPENIKSSQIIDSINSLNIDILKNIKIFDIYRGGSIEKDKTSIALNFYFNKQSATLTDTEVEEKMTLILNNLKKSFGAVLR